MTRYLPFCILLAVGCGGKGPPVAPPEPPVVTVEHPMERELDTYFEFTGYLKAARELEVRAQVTGYLKVIKFKDGQIVRPGDVLYEIDPEPYEAALLNAKANLATSEASLKRGDADSLTARERQSLAKLEYDRQEKLKADGSASQQEYDKAKSELTAATSNFQAATAGRDSAAAARDAAKAALRKAEFDRNNCTIRLNASDITAPENVTMSTPPDQVQGRISRTLITEGNLVASGQTILCRVVSLNPVYAYWDLDEMTSLTYRRLIYDDKTLPDPRIHALKCWIGGKTDTGYPVEGYVNYVSPEIARGTATREVRGVFPNLDQRLSPGDSIRVKALAGPPARKVTIPEIAVGTRQQQKFVYVVVPKDGQDVAEFRPITTGPVRVINGVRLQVVETGLTPADKVVVNGLLRVRAGAAVKPTEQTSPVTPK
ncbi:efflux RND transporter periplasmic adaptor subunit [Limnoglobus roseus]|uniref:Efflux RND transporter periplasmic adaptor subunit n=1 Tax=Limnoglobus roseus TaxID=2598579 RepID=A0A5C1AU84_9BACT|nr:efflux RND transporter periplasmic adaptor subunit [Limnoglobus roseus]QEL20794.1 efflux RND transporter periplasmic adaptor subunit [Limnoglobus roseus]